MPIFFFNCMFYQLLRVQHDCSSTQSWGSVLPSIVAKEHKLWPRGRGLFTMTSPSVTSQLSMTSLRLIQIPFIILYTPDFNFTFTLQLYQQGRFAVSHETRDQNSWGCPLLFWNRNLGSFMCIGDRNPLHPQPLGSCGPLQE